MSLSITEDFQRDGFDLISCHSPLILTAELGNANATASTGDIVVSIRGQTGMDNTTLYQFDMGYIESTGSGPYVHYFRLDITDIIRNICNEPRLENEVSSYYVDDCRLATYIGIEVNSPGESLDNVIEWFMHGFNQVNTPDSSCLVDFADPDEDAIISIVPGVPQLFNLWLPAAVSSGTLRVRVDANGNNIVDGGITVPAAKGLYQFYAMTDFGEDLYDAFTMPHTLYKLYLFENPGPLEDTLATIDMIAFKKACPGDVVLTWLNRYGTYSSMAFERFPTYKREQKHIGSFDLEVTDIADMQSRKKSRGYQDVQTVISAVASRVPTEYFEAIEDLFYSMDVYMYNGTPPDYSFGSTGVEWTRVTVRGTLTDRRKRKHEAVRVDITLPEKYTQLR